MPCDLEPRAVPGGRMSMKPREEITRGLTHSAWSAMATLLTLATRHKATTKEYNIGRTGGSRSLNRAGFRQRVTLSQRDCKFWMTGMAWMLGWVDTSRMFHDCGLGSVSYI